MQGMLVANLTPREFLSGGCETHNSQLISPHRKLGSKYSDSLSGWEVVVVVVVGGWGVMPIELR